MRSWLHLPAMLALIKQTNEPVTNARNESEATSPRFSGTSAPKPPIKIPNEHGFAKPQIANVVIAELRSWPKH